MQSSGFFDSSYDILTNEYDREYYSSEFASYFAMFIKNGVFGSPTNQLKVSPGSGLNVIVSPGRAFINGYWYYNDTELILPVPPNVTSVARTDTVKCRWNNVDRRIVSAYFADVGVNVRDGTNYDLMLGKIIIPAAATQILVSNITDMRIDETVCGLVTSLLQVQTTKDLFSQYQALFEQWFNDVKGQVTGDLAIRIQLEIGDLSKLATTIKSSLVAAINEIKAETKGIFDGTFTVKKAESATSAATAGSATNATNAEEAKVADKLKTPRKINGEEFDGSKDITIKDNTKAELDHYHGELKKVRYSTTIPVSVEEGEIVMVYED